MEIIPLTVTPKQQHINLIRYMIPKKTIHLYVDKFNSEQHNTILIDFINAIFDNIIYRPKNISLIK